MKYCLLFVLLLTFTACDTSKPLVSSEQEFTGRIQKQGITTYQYGTHTLSNSTAFYALRSSTVNLDNYIDSTITIVGEYIEGYPVENGPEYIEVKKVK